MPVVAGSAWINGNDFHYIDESILERVFTGKLIAAVSARPGSVWIEGNLLRYVNEAGTEIRQLSGKSALVGSSARSGSIWVEGDKLYWIGHTNPEYKFCAYDEIAEPEGEPMIEIAIPGAITVDVCWHSGRIYVARHSPPNLIVESYAADLSGVTTTFLRWTWRQCCRTVNIS